MNMEERVKRINELYHKSKEEGLTQEEILEQAVLRRQYLDNIKANLQEQLKNIRFVEDEMQEDAAQKNETQEDTVQENETQEDTVQEDKTDD